MNIVRTEIVLEAADLKPTYGSAWAAGMDLRAAEDYTVENGKITKIRTGVKIAIPHNQFGLVMPRSGLASKEGIVLSTSGVIDPDYRGELFVAVTRNIPGSLEIKRGDRIAQMMLIPFVQADFSIVEALDATPRGEDGHGSTGN